jgi:large conductance mechanosensitive channel
MLKEFRKFALRGNVIDMAVGIIIGASFSSIVKSLVDDILMPPIGWLLGGVDFSNNYLTVNAGMPAGPYPSLADAQLAGAITVNYGLFINALINFLIVAIAMFLLIRAINRLQASQDQEHIDSIPKTKECQYCFSVIPVQASRCSHCTSQLD